MSPRSTIQDRPDKPLRELSERIAHLEAEAGRTRARMGRVLGASVFLLSGLALIVVLQTQRPLGGLAATQLHAPYVGRAVPALRQRPADREESLFANHIVEIGVGLLGGLFAIAITVYLFTRPV